MIIWLEPILLLPVNKIRCAGSLYRIPAWPYYRIDIFISFETTLHYAIDVIIIMHKVNTQNE